jgi:hypothetical protein
MHANCLLLCFHFKINDYFRLEMLFSDKSTNCDIQTSKFDNFRVIFQQILADIVGITFVFMQKFNLKFIEKKIFCHPFFCKKI